MLGSKFYSRKFYCVPAITELVAIMRKGKLAEESCKIHVYMYILSSLKVTDSLLQGNLLGFNTTFILVE